MKTTAFLIVFTFLAFIANGQNWETNILEDVDVTPPIFTGVKESPAVLNTNNTIQNYLAENLELPESAKKYNLEGTVIVQFTVLPNGNLDYFDIINSVSNEIDREVINTLQATDGMWKPGFNNTSPVAMTKEVGIAFVWENNDHVKLAQRLCQRANKKILKDKNKKALRLYNHAMVYQPYSEALIFARSVARYNAGDEAGACEDWNRLRSLGGNLADIYLANYCEVDYADNLPIDKTFYTYNMKK